MFAMLTNHGPLIEDKQLILDIMSDPVFDNFSNINILPLIYDEKNQRCNIFVFDYDRAKTSIARIILLEEGSGRKHPAYRFLDAEGEYICEVRYGGATANALQRGFWTHTRNALKHFDSLTEGWIDYSTSPTLIKLFSHALLSTSSGHNAALAELLKDVDEQKQRSSL